LVAALIDLLDRGYHELADWGTTAPGRALVSSVTNPIALAATLARVTGSGYRLDDVTVRRSTFSRPHSDCWDVVLAFRDPERQDWARWLHRHTVDVADVVRSLLRCSRRRVSTSRWCEPGRCVGPVVRGRAVCPGRRAVPRAGSEGPFGPAVRDRRPVPGPRQQHRLAGMSRTAGAATTTGPAGGPGPVGDGHLERYLARAGAVQWDPDRFGPLTVDRAVARAVWLLACVEADSTSQTAKVERANFTRGADVAAFLPHWYAEEQQHGRLLFALARVSGFDPPPAARLRSAAEQDGQPSDRLRAVLGRLPGADAAYLATAAAAEYTAGCMYRWLGAQYAATPKVTRMFKDLAAQEARHLAFYRAAAHLRLARSASARALAPRLFSRFWRPVGIDTLGRSTWFDAFGELVADPVMQPRFLGLDRIVGSLPGFEGVAPLRAFLADHDIAAVVPA